MANLSQEFYRVFHESFHEYVMSHATEFWDKEVSDKAWSQAMFEVLSQVAKKMGFESIEPEKGTIRAQRFDMVWKTSTDPKKVIVLEHENYGIKYALKEEMPKLADTRAMLHVCITYVKDSEFPGREYAEQLRKELERRGYDNEFLLILGSDSMNSPNDWVCHRVYPEVKLGLETFILSSPIWLTPKQAERMKKIEVSEDVLLKENPTLSSLYQEVKKYVLTLGKVKSYTVGRSVIFRSKKVFGKLWFAKKWISLELLVGKGVIQSERFTYWRKGESDWGYVHLTPKEGLDEEIKNWIRIAFDKAS